MATLRHYPGTMPTVGLPPQKPDSLGAVFRSQFRGGIKQATKKPIERLEGKRERPAETDRPEPCVGYIEKPLIRRSCNSGNPEIEFRHFARLRL